MKAPRKKKNGWQRTPTPNLARWVPSGFYYLRVRIGRENAYRKSLRTDDYETARSLLGPALAELRAAAPLRKGERPTTLHDALKVVQAQIEANPALKRRSVHAYLDVLKALRRPVEKGGVPNVPLISLTPEEMEQWWKTTAAIFAPAKANFHLLVVRRAFRTARESGAIIRDPVNGLKRVHVPPSKLNLITTEEFAKLVTAIRKDDDDDAEDAADWIEFACYTGARPEEVNSVWWEHVDHHRRLLTIVGGEEGTKNRQTRRIPVTDALAGLLERIATRRGNSSGSVLVPSQYYGKILSRVSAAIGLPRLRRYDMRHLFATRCNEAGIDAATFSRWLGHKDGGALALRVYVHPHEDHDQRSAAKVQF